MIKSDLPPSQKPVCFPRRVHSLSKTKAQLYLRLHPKFYNEQIISMICLGFQFITWNILLFLVTFPNRARLSLGILGVPLNAEKLESK